MSSVNFMFAGIPPWVALQADGNLMCSPRALHTSTVVGNAVFLIGGLQCSSSQIDVYDTRNNSWTSIQTSNHGVLPHVLYSHTSVLCGDHIYVFGGCDGREVPCADLWRLHVPTMAWERSEVAVRSPHLHPAPRRGHSACLLGTASRMIVYGGRGDGGIVFDDVWHLHLDSGVWTRVPTHIAQTMGCHDLLGGDMRRCYHSAVWDTKGNAMIVFAGSWGCVTNTIYMYTFEITSDGITCTVTFVHCSGFVPTSRCNHSCVIHNSRLHIVGGREVEASGDWDPSPIIYETYVKLLVKDSNWVRVPSNGHFPTARWGHTTAILGDHMYLFGGIDGAQSILNDMFKVRLVAMTADVMSDMRTGVLQTTAVAPLPRGEVLRMLREDSQRRHVATGEKRTMRMEE